MVTTVDEEIEALGMFAAECDLMAADPALTNREREQLEASAERYRELQMDALEVRERILRHS